MVTKVSSKWRRGGMAPWLGAGPDLGVEVAQAVQEGLREGRERLDDVEQDGQRHAGADRDGGLLEPFAGLGADGVGAGEPFAVADDGEEAGSGFVGAGVG